MIALSPAILDSGLREQPCPPNVGCWQGCSVMDRSGFSEIRDALGSKEADLGPRTSRGAAYGETVCQAHLRAYDHALRHRGQLAAADERT